MYNPSISSLFVGIGASRCEKDAKTGGWEGAEGRTALRGGDLTALTREVGLCGTGTCLVLSARSTAKKPNGSESEDLEGVPRWCWYGAVVGAPAEWSVKWVWSMFVEGGRGELGGRVDEEREQNQLGGSAG